MSPNSQIEYPNLFGAPGVLYDAPFDQAKAKTVELSKRSYPFVDLIRFVATIGIVFLHSEVPLSGMEITKFLHHVKHAEYYFLLKQIFKFSTICYFMIAGFLLADKITETSQFNYYMRRLNVIVRPYLLALALFTLMMVINEYFLNHYHFKWLFIPVAFKFIVLYTAYWYIPNYLLCLLVIVFFAGYASSIYFGGFLLLITLGYTFFYVYSQHHSGSHTTALFGFVFYMWLGMYIRQNNLVDEIKKISLLTIGLVMVIVCLCANYETYYLFNFTHTHDAFNTLRISNQLYSIIVFAFLVRCCGKAPNFGIFNPRTETYGIYLYHSFFSVFAIPALELLVCNYFHVSLFSYNVYEVILITLVNCTLCYFATTALVKVLLRFKLFYLPRIDKAKVIDKNTA